MNKPGFMLILCGIITLNSVNGNPVSKRGIFDYNYGTVMPNFGNSGLAQDFSSFPGEVFPIVAPLAPPPTSHFFVQKPILLQKIYAEAPSPAEIAAAVTAAKEASANVMAAQERVQIAKEDVLTQQKIASQKEAQAALALQQTEAAAAVQRQQASAAANAVVSAQQRLAQAKADVAEKQRIAAEKESAAAFVIQRSAAAAAAEIRKTESTAAKVAAIHSSQAAAALKYVTAAKDATLAATSAAVAAASEHSGSAGAGPWVTPGKATHFTSWR